MEQTVVERLNLSISIASQAYGNWDKRNGLSSYVSIILYELSIHDRMTQRELIKLTSIPKQSISKGIHRLDDQGYLMIMLSQRDSRVRYCRLTDQGREYAASVVEPLMTLERIVSMELGDQKMHDLACLMTQWGHRFSHLVEQQK
ncbi:MAG: MarR family winged helix-turn-helix transcriptional regulator [Lactobacillus sp.]|nr:MarR family transcriptional regulator [Lactobacillus sp.]MDN6043150.1 MarR family transcriptional regulator [Lactobacillus sp.]MDN6053300.1 MarR family transcriptional regulator [Lactobacillus sp.]